MTRNSQAGVFLAAMTLCATASLAQLGGGVSASRDAKLEPPTPNFRTESGGEVMPIIWTVLLVGLGVGVNLIPTKRGHQD
jgi:hypothetical protein